jgi:hypothetical protein
VAYAAWYPPIFLLAGATAAPAGSCLSLWPAQGANSPITRARSRHNSPNSVRTRGSDFAGQITFESRDYF